MCRRAGKVKPDSVMDGVEEFLRAPSEDFLEQCSQEPLIKIARHFKLDVSDKRLKENMKNILKGNLVEAGVLQSKQSVLGASAANIMMKMLD